MHTINNEIIDSIKNEIQVIEAEILYLITRKKELEEDWHGYEYEKIDEIEKRINKLKRRKEQLENKLYELM